MAWVDDFSVAANGDIRHVSGTSHYTVLEMHRALADLSDNTTASGDDLLDIITDVTQSPSSRNFDTIIVLNGNYNIDDTAAQFLYGGSVSQNGGNTLYSGLQILGSVNNTATTLQVIQNNAKLTSFWGDQSTGGYNGNAAGNILARFLVKSRDGGADIDGKRVRVQARHWGDTYAFFNATLGVGESVAAIQTVADGQNTTTQGTVTAYTHVTNTEGFQLIDLNNGSGNREYYSKWTFGADTSGDGLKGLYEYSKDLVGTGTAKTIHGINGELFLGITHSFAYDNELTGPLQEDEILSWGTGATAGTGILLALDDDGVTGNLYIQLITGVAPTDGLVVTGGTSSATVDVNGAVTSKTVSPMFLGSYTGTLIGAFGVGVDSGDLTSSDKLVDLSGTDQTPPNNVTVSVSGLVNGEDRVLLGRDSQDQYTLNYDNELTGPFTIGEPLTYTGGTATLVKLTDAGVTGSMVIRVLTGVAPANDVTLTGVTSTTTADTNGTPVLIASLETNTYTLAAGNTVGNGTLVIAEAIASDEPAVGSLRVWNASTTSFDRYAYTSWTGSTFTLSGTLSQTYTTTDPVFVPFIDDVAAADSLSNTLVFGTNIPVVGTVRDGGVTPIVPFPITGTVTSGGFSVSAVRQADA